MKKIAYLFQGAFLFGVFLLFFMETQVPRKQFHILTRRLQEVTHYYEPSGNFSPSAVVNSIWNHTENATQYSEYPTSSTVVPLTTSDSEMDHSGVKVKKVLLLAYLKGGSTFLGRLFASNPDAFYWFEIVQPMYLAMMGLMAIPYEELYTLDGTKREQTQDEMDFILEHLDKFYNCRLDELPMEMPYQDSVPLSGPEWNTYVMCMKSKTKKPGWQTLTNECRKKLLSPRCRTNAPEAKDVGCFDAKMALDGRKMSKTHAVDDASFAETEKTVKAYWDCMHQSPLKSAFDACVPLAKHSCEASSIRAAKVLRMKLRDTEKLVQMDPTFKVVHQLRDPRGALMSAKSIGLFASSSKRRVTNEAKLVCDKMLDDIRAFRELKEKYPNNYIQTKYEDYADHPEQMIEKIYSHIHSPIPNTLRRAIRDITHSRYEPRHAGALDTHRRNSSATAHKWKLKINKSEKSVIDQICLRAIQEGGYNL